MDTLRKGITGIMLAALLAIGGLGFSAQSEAVEFTQEVQATAQVNAECTYGTEWDCGWFSCSCDGKTTRLCEGSSDCPRYQ